MSNNDFIIKIRSSYNQFTKAEKRVADFIIKQPKKVLFMSISDLADACKVGDTSVFRFCKTMKLQGYQEFKMQLSLGMNDTTDIELPSDDQSEEKDSFKLLSQKVLKRNVSAINETYGLLNKEEFLKAITYMEQAQQIYFFGVGASLLTAMIATNRFLRITPKVHYVEDSHMQAMTASMLTKNDLAIVISYSGSTKDTIHVAKLAKENNTPVISITRYKKSPLTSYSDITILCGANEGPLDGGSTSACMSQLYLTDLMYVEFYNRKYAISNSNRMKTSESVLEKMY